MSETLARVQMLAARLEDEEIAVNTIQNAIIHEGRYAAEVPYRETDDGSPFGATVEKEDALKLNRVRLALRSGDVAAPAKEARVFELMLLAGE